jgi:hypothetical protein
MLFDIRAQITFLTTAEGGRQSPTPANFFSCPMIIKHQRFDSRLQLTEIGFISPGDTVEVPIKFLDTDQVLSLLTVGESFELWESRTIARGKVLSLASNPPREFKSRREEISA